MVSALTERDAANACCHGIFGTADWNRHASVSERSELCPTAFVCIFCCSYTLAVALDVHGAVWFGARLSQIVLSVATAAGSSLLRSVYVDFYVVAVSCGLWSAPFPIWSSRALSVYILSTSVFSCRLEGLSISVPYCSRLSITLAYFSSPFGITTKSTTCTQTSCLMILLSFRHLTTFSTMFLDELMVSKRVVHHQQSLHAKAYPSTQSIWLETFLGSTLGSGTDLWLPRRLVQLMQLLALSVRAKAQKTLPTGCKFCLRTVLWLPLRRQSPCMLDPSLAPNGSARKLKTPTTTAWQTSWTTRFRACISRKGS